METWLDLPAVFRCMFAHLGLGICAEFSVSTFSCSGFPFAFVSGVEITGAIPTQVPHFSAIFWFQKSDHLLIPPSTSTWLVKRAADVAPPPDVLEEEDFDKSWTPRSHTDRGDSLTTAPWR